MPAATLPGSNRDAAVFLISAYGAYEVIAAACSSPQTSEINAGVRGETLMKWVHIGLAQVFVLAGIAIFVEPPKAKAITAGALLGSGMMYASYVHARAAGLASSAPPTEDWGPIQ